MKTIPWFIWVLGAAVVVASYFYYKARTTPSTSTIMNDSDGSFGQAY